MFRPVGSRSIQSVVFKMRKPQQRERRSEKNRQGASIEIIQSPIRRQKMMNCFMYQRPVRRRRQYARHKQKRHPYSFARQQCRHSEQLEQSNGEKRGDQNRVKPGRDGGVNLPAGNGFHESSLFLLCRRAVTTRESPTPDKSVACVVPQPWQFVCRKKSRRRRPRASFGWWRPRQESNLQPAA